MGRKPGVVGSSPTIEAPLTRRSRLDFIISSGEKFSCHWLRLSYTVTSRHRGAVRLWRTLYSCCVPEVL